MIPSTGVAGALVKTSSARPAGLTLRSAAGLVLPGPGLGVGAGVISGKSPAAFPAPTKFVLTFTFGRGPGMAAAWMAPRRLAAPPGPMSELAALFGFGGGPGDGTLADGSGDAELVVPALAVAEPDPVELAVGVGLEEAEGVGLAVAVGDVAGAELALGVGAGDVERVGLGVDVGEEDVEGAGLSLAVGVDIDGDGLGVPESLAGARAGRGRGGRGGNRARERGILRADRQPEDEETSSHQAGCHRPADARQTCEPPCLDLLHLLPGRRAALIF